MLPSFPRIFLDALCHSLCAVSGFSRLRVPHCCTEYTAHVHPYSQHLAPLELRGPLAHGKYCSLCGDCRPHSTVRLAANGVTAAQPVIATGPASDGCPSRSNPDWVSRAYVRRTRLPRHQGRLLQCDPHSTIEIRVRRQPSGLSLIHI